MTATALQMREAPDAGVGRDIRALRRSRGLTLAELALRLGRSVGFLSQVERGLSAPTIEDLRALAAAFGVPVSWFFGTPGGDPAEAAHVVRAANRRALGTEEGGIVEELLSPDLGGSFEMFRSQFAVGAAMAEPVHRETEEAGYVVAGAFEIEINGTPHLLAAGDSFRFENLPYRWRNAGDVPCIVIWTVAPPIY